MKKIFVFDFDGVICDSSYECLISSWNAWQIFNKKVNFRYEILSFEQLYINNFLKLRPYVRGAGEFFLVHKLIELDVEVNSQNEYDLLVLENKQFIDDFKKLVYDEREKLRSNQEKKWIDLHFMYKEVVEIMMSIPSENLFIATLKDAKSVSILLASVNINIENSRILDQSMIKSKLDALDQISMISNRKKDEIVLIDDNINHLIPPKTFGYNVFLTTWGNVLPEFSAIADSYGIEKVFLENLKVIL